MASSPAQTSPLLNCETEPSPPLVFDVMVKPRGSICNLACTYCYYSAKKELYPGSNFRMGDSTLEEFTRQHIDARQVPEVSFSWQGGEPTLMGIDFYEKALAYQRKYAPAGVRITNTLQTNGTLLDEAWCSFFKENDFLLGISIDGPRELHDRYRVDSGGMATFDRVMGGLGLLMSHGVEFNVLVTVHAANQDHPLEVYNFFRDLGVRFLQFIPIVERDFATAGYGRDGVSDLSVGDAAFGQFMIAVFDEWVRRDVGEVFVQIFDVALAAWIGQGSTLCIFAEACSGALALEHNGDLYSCDHFVEPTHLLGNIKQRPLAEMSASPQQRRFGQVKLDSLSGQCRDCEVRFVCNGGCPKDRFVKTSESEAAQNYLCDSYRPFFNHVRTAMEFMAAELAARRSPSNVTAMMAALDMGPTGADRNQPCPCGSGKKFKRCHRSSSA